MIIETVEELEALSNGIYGVKREDRDDWALAFIVTRHTITKEVFFIITGHTCCNSAKDTWQYYMRFKPELIILSQLSS